MYSDKQAHPLHDVRECRCIERVHQAPNSAKTPNQNLLKAFAAALFFDTRRTLNRTVLERGRH